MCAGLTAFRAIKESDAKPGQIVGKSQFKERHYFPPSDVPLPIAIAGAGGGVGTMACQYAKARGCRVLAISQGPEKRKLCLEELGVDYFVDYLASEDIVQEVRALTDGGPHAVIVVSTSETLLHSACQVMLDLEMGSRAVQLIIFLVRSQYGYYRSGGTASKRTNEHRPV